MPEGAWTPVLWTIFAIVLAITLILVGWRNLKARQSQIPEPYAAFEDQAEHSFAGMYVVTTEFDDWLARIAVHDLGVRTNATLELGRAGIHLIRSGARDVHIPWEQYVQVKRSNGMVGKVVEKNGLIVITWTKDGFTFDTGFRPRYSEDTPKIYQLLASHVDVSRAGDK
ncbi:MULTISPECIES: PH-like domain-containing protein [Glutamicibacter]|jgi:hypothetical protein|uniref:Conserved hypothetical membrane protein n=1 Tax=Glutamicibacter arilaitensis (strain DSM 16368 / CIP 108037 / IAM 15318 / JCM 13566 / NCIMB 14258 / Re117) TaxID=861360 RepID=A0ABM9PX87_GLUAR|nr:MULTISPECIES: hypothetical protein [Glutamicibacter]CBT75929.1 conserved hypothetical membrane protein [Glutamicibacter arilaitensis Re117]HCH46976.1 hypothetical protein [Glutamicibacter sp.]HCM93961.1 hypothetical protein [Glutamicibacter sp.]